MDTDDDGSVSGLVTSPGGVNHRLAMETSHTTRTFADLRDDPSFETVIGSTLDDAVQLLRPP